MPFGSMCKSYKDKRTHIYIYILCSKTNIHRCNMKHIEISFPPTPPPGVGIGFEPATYRYLSRRPRSCTAEKDASNWIWKISAPGTHTFLPVPQSSWKSSEYWPYSGYIPSWSLQPHQISWFQYTCRTVPRVVQRSLESGDASVPHWPKSTAWRSEGLEKPERTWAKVEAFEQSRPIRRSCPLLLEEEYRCESRPGALRSDEYSEGRAPSGGTEDLGVEISGTSNSMNHVYVVIMYSDWLQPCRYDENGGKILNEKTQDGLQQSRSPFKLLTVSGSIFASNFGKRAENSGELKLIASAFPCQSLPLSKAPRVPRGSWSKLEASQVAHAKCSSEARDKHSKVLVPRVGSIWCSMVR